MAMNDKDSTLIGARGVDVHPGIANPTSSSTHADPLAANFVRTISSSKGLTRTHFANVPGHRPYY